MSFRPVVTFTYFIDYALYGLKAWGYHLTNVFLHAINGILFYFFLTLFLNFKVKNYIDLTLPPFLISLLFVTHPVLTEAVNCISYREDLLVFLFYMATFNLYLILRNQTTGHRPLTSVFLYFLSCFAYLLALLSKEMAITLPLIVVCYEWLYGREKAKLPYVFTISHIKKGSVSAAPCAADIRATLDAATKVNDNMSFRLFNRYNIGYITITLFYLYLRFYLFHNPEEHIHGWGLVEKFFTLPWLIISYLRLSLIPVQLSSIYVINPVISFFSPIFLLSIIALISIFTIIVATRNTEKSILFGTLFFLITLTPVYNLLPLFNPFAERYLYLPSAGYVITIGSILCILKTHQKSRTLVICLLILIMSLFSFLVIKRNRIWMNNYSLWNAELKKKPDNFRAHNNLGYTYYNEGLIDEAIKEFLIALRIAPNYIDAHYNIGNAYGEKGWHDLAIKEYTITLRLKPDHVKARNNLGLLYSDQGKYDEAIKEFSTALKNNPTDSDVYNNLGLVYFKQGRVDEAITEYLSALRLEPENIDAKNNIGLAYFKQGKFDNAIKEFVTALKRKPDHINAYFNLGLVYIRLGRIQDAKRQFEIVLKLKANDVQAIQALKLLEGKK